MQHTQMVREIQSIHTTCVVNNVDLGVIVEESDECLGMGVCALPATPVTYKPIMNIMSDF